MYPIYWMHSNHSACFLALLRSSFSSGFCFTYFLCWVSFLIHSRLLFLIIAFLHAEVLFQSRASQLLIALLLGWGVPGLHPNNSAQAACLHSTALPSVQLLPSSISLPRQKVEPVRERPINALLTSPGGDKESGVKKWPYTNSTPIVHE